MRSIVVAVLSSGEYVVDLSVWYSNSTVLSSIFFNCLLLYFWYYCPSLHTLCWSRLLLLSCCQVVSVLMFSTGYLLQIATNVVSFILTIRCTMFWHVNVAGVWCVPVNIIFMVYGKSPLALCIVMSARDSTYVMFSWLFPLSLSYFLFISFGFFLIF